MGRIEEGMIFVGIDTQYASESEHEEVALREAAAYFRDQLNAYLRGEALADLVFVTEKEDM